MSPSKKDNRGFSLIELLIAITILSIVVAVLYRSFVVSARVNAKAKVQHQATSLAQDIMEACKSVDMDELMMQFENPVYYTRDADNASILYKHFNLLPESVLNDTALTGPAQAKNYIGTFAAKSQKKDVAEGESAAITSYITAVKDKAVYATNDPTQLLYYVKEGTYVPTAKGDYYLYLQDLQMGQVHYDALITLNGLPYMEDAANGNVVSSGQAYNSTDLVQLPNMDASVDVISSNSTTFDPEAESQLASILARKTGAAPFDVANVSREIVIRVEEEVMAGADVRVQQKVEVAYNYSYSDPGTGSTFSIQLHRDYPFDNTSDLSTNLRNVFLFYNPRKDYKEDRIHLIRQVYPEAWRNSEDNKLDVYIVKMMPSDYNGLAWDNDYRPVLEVEEGADVSDTGVITDPYDTPSIVLHTNLGYYMTQDATSGEFKPMTNCQVTWDGTNYGFLYNSTPNTDPKTALGITTLTNKKSVERIFEITVEIFRRESDGVLGYDDFVAKRTAGEAKATITGTIRN